MAYIRPTTWDIDGQRLHGVRINSGQHFLFIPDNEVLELALSLADYLERERNRGTIQHTR